MFIQVPGDDEEGEKMVPPKVHSIMSGLSSFSLGLKNYEAYRIISKTKGITRQQTVEMMSLRERLMREVGKFGPLITELTGKERIQPLGKGPEYSYDMWAAALRVKFDSRSYNALRICIDYTDRARGKLDDEIEMGIRDKQGKVIEKLQTIDIEAPKVFTVQGEKNLIAESKANWKAIESEFGITKKSFGKKIKFVSGSYKRKIIFRDVEDSFMLASSGYSKPAAILAGGVIEELLRLYLKHRGFPPTKRNFDGYIQTCKEKGLLKSGVSNLTDSVRYFRNLVHLQREKASKYSISKATAKGAVSSIFTIANDF